MKVFISWSGASSRSLAEALHWWLPKVIQGVQPFLSAKDIDKGANWTHVLAQELEDAEFGIICVTRENLASGWLNYEAGAITKSVDSRVCPLLLGLDKSDVQGPLAQLQLTDLQRDDIMLMARSMNKTAGSPLTDEHVDEAVEMWWPRLEERTGGIPLPDATPVAKAPEPDKPVASELEMLHEVLQAVRNLDRRLADLEPRPGTSRPTQSIWTVELLSALAESGIHARRATHGKAGVTLWTDQQLPQPLPPEVYQKLGEAAKERGLRVTLRGADREVNFSEIGIPDEPPF